MKNFQVIVRKTPPPPQIPPSISSSYNLGEVRGAYSSTGSLGAEKSRVASLGGTKSTNTLPEIDQRVYASAAYERKTPPPSISTPHTHLSALQSYSPVHAYQLDDTRSTNSPHPPPLAKKNETSPRVFKFPQTPTSPRPPFAAILNHPSLPSTIPHSPKTH